MQDRNGKTVYRHEPRACRGCGEQAAAGKPVAPEIVDSRKPFHDPASVYQVVHMMLGVTTRGTAGRLAALGRPIAGKTGTTNDARDNWFIGSTPDITIGIYIGFDEPRTLGHGNARPAAATPRRSTRRMAKQIFKDKPPTPFRIPPGLRMVQVSDLRGRHDRRGLQARHRARRRTGFSQHRRLTARRALVRYRPRRPAAGGRRPAPGSLGNGRDVGR